MSIIFPLLSESNLLDADVPLIYGGEQFVARIQAKTGGSREPVGLVLSGGSARAFAHIGVLKYLEEQGIVPDFIVSNSMGSIIGMLYGAGLSPDQILEIMTDTDIGGLFDIALPANRGLINSDRFRSLVSAFLGEDLRMENLDIPVMVVCEDLVTKQQIRICEGDFFDVLDASYALPVYFSSISYNGHKLVDGGIANISPVGIAYDYSTCNMVSTTFYAGKNLNLNNPITALNTSIDVGKRRQGVVDLLNHPDAVWIRCNVEEFSFMEFSASELLCEKGYESALEQADAIGVLKAKAGGSFTGPSHDLMDKRAAYTDVLKSVHKEYAPFQHVKNSVVSFYPSITGSTKDTALRHDTSLGAGFSFAAGNFNLNALAGASIALSTDDAYCRGLLGAEAAWYILPPLRLSAGFSWFPFTEDTHTASYQHALSSWTADGALCLRLPDVLPDGALELKAGAEYTSGNFFGALVSAKADANFKSLALGLTAGVRSVCPVTAPDDLKDIVNSDNFIYYGDLSVSLVNRAFSRGFAEMLIVTNPRIGAFCTADYIVRDPAKLPNSSAGSSAGSSGSSSYSTLSITAGLELGTTVGLIGLRNIPFTLRGGWNFADESVYASLKIGL